jgi:hypothetical protein
VSWIDPGPLEEEQAARARRRRRHTIAGRVVATAALVTIAALSARNLAEADRASRPTPIGALVTLSTAQTLFREGDEDGDGVLDYGTLEELSDARLIDAVLGAGVKQGYRFDCRPSPTTPEFVWMAVANPVSDETGSRSFVTNHTGMIHWSPEPLRWTPDCEIPAGLLRVGEERR